MKINLQRGHAGRKMGFFKSKVFVLLNIHTIYTIHETSTPRISHMHLRIELAGWLPAPGHRQKMDWFDY
jgi:hypothetical protein